jgi:serine protease Do
MEVKPGSVAEDKGIMRGDIIKQINGASVGNTSEYGKIVSRLKKGEMVRMLVHRGDSSLFLAFPVE